MLKGELKILADIVFKKPTATQITTSQTARDNFSIFLTLDTLRRDGFITRNKDKRYQITDKGLNTLAELYPEFSASNKTFYDDLLNEKTNKADRAIKSMAQLRREYIAKIFFTDVKS
jgi:DNA-binding PadR family transcriptional regulator